MSDAGDVVIVTIFGKTGSSLGEFKDIEFRSALWRLGNSGTARCVFPRNGAKATRANLRSGNRVLIEFGDGLPEWGGVLDFPIDYGSHQELDLTFYEGERLLDWRISGANEVYSATVTGSILQALIENANGVAQSGVYIGNIYSGGTAYTRDYHYESLLAAVTDMVDDSGYNYAVVPVKIGGKLYFDFSWYERRGTDRRDEVSLIEGENVGALSISEQGPIYNSVTIVGKGEGNWGDRPTVYAVDATSQSRYGLREFPKFYFDISDETTLQAIADALVAAYKDPKVGITLDDVTNEAPSLFSEYGVGDIVHLAGLSDFGEFSFDDPVRILSRQRMVGGSCVLEVEKWQGT